MAERIWWSCWCLWIRCIFFDNEGDKWPQGRIGGEVAEEGFKEGLERGRLCVDEGLWRFLLSFLWGCEGILLCVIEDYVCPSNCFVGQQLVREFLFLLSIYPVGIFVLNIVVIHIIQCDQAATAAVTFSWHLVYVCRSCVPGTRFCVQERRRKEQEASRRRRLRLTK